MSTLLLAEKGEDVVAIQVVPRSFCGIIHSKAVFITVPFISPPMVRFQRRPVIFVDVVDANPHAFAIAKDIFDVFVRRCRFEHGEVRTFSLASLTSLQPRTQRFRVELVGKPVSIGWIVTLIAIVAT